MRRWGSSRAGALRDYLLLFGGLLGTAHQTVIAQVDRPWLLGLFAAMMGLPYAFAADRSSQRSDPDPPAAPAPPSLPVSPGSGSGASPSATSSEAA